jgi:hypothetical protein
MLTEINAFEILGTNNFRFSTALYGTVRHCRAQFSSTLPRHITRNISSFFEDGNLRKFAERNPTELFFYIFVFSTP